MNERLDGGPAFPGPDGFDGAGRSVDVRGMSLRDYFAAQALPQAIRAELDLRAEQITPGAFDFSRAAWASYAIADAMLAERAQ